MDAMYYHSGLDKALSVCRAALSDIVYTHCLATYGHRSSSVCEPPTFAVTRAHEISDRSISPAQVPAAVPRASLAILTA